MKEYGKMNTYLIEFNQEKNRENICREINNSGAHYCGELKVPFWNIFGQVLFDNFCIVYQHTEELNFDHEDFI